MTNRLYLRCLFFGLAFTFNVIPAHSQSIINSVIDIASDANVPVNRDVNYSIGYFFQSILDTTKGTVKLVKDPKTDFVSAVPAYNSVSGDTLIWNFSSTVTQVHIINFTLHIKDTPFVHTGEYIKNTCFLRFAAVDTLRKTDSILQLVNAICVSADLTNTTLAPPLGIQWVRPFGGSSGDAGYGLAVLPDNSFVAVTNTSSQDGDVAGSSFQNYAVKYLANGNIVWKKAIGGSVGDYLRSIEKAADGSFILVGTSSSGDATLPTNHGIADTWLTKLDSNGNLVWQKLVGGTGLDGGEPVIRKFRDGKYLVMASTYSNNGDVVNPYPGLQKKRPWLFMINENGNITWQKVFPDTLFDSFNDIRITRDMGFIIAGDMGSTDPSTGFTWAGRLVKTDSTGAILYVKDYKNPDRHLGITSVVENADSSFTFAGYIKPKNPNSAYAYCIGDHGGDDVWVAKTNKTGTLIWQKYYGGDSYDNPSGIIGMQNGGYLVTAITMSNNGNVTGFHGIPRANADIWLLSVGDNGDLAWQKTIGGDSAELAFQSIQLTTGDIIVNGSFYSYNNGDIFGNRGSGDAFVCKIGAANTIRGIVYLDQNGNHIKDTNEPYFTGGIVKSSRGDLVSATNIINGFYANTVDTGSFITQPIINFPYYTAYPLTHNSQFNSYMQADTIDFAMVPIAGVNDLKITLLPLTGIRPGNETQYKIRYENIGTTTLVNGSVSLVKDHRTVFDSATVVYSSLAADTIKWNFSNFAPMEAKEIIVYLKLATPPLLNIGDSLDSYATINPLAGDSTPLNNLAAVHQLVTGSYDPNDKTETHGPGFPAQQLSNGEYLNYIIRFQNTGTDTAFRVLVKDTLDTKLDWSSFEMISASHSYQLSIKDQNMLEWKFDPIILPDSIHSEPKSHGYIAYRIKPRPDLTEGDTIANRAAIYFDFNLPVLTNIQHTVIDSGKSICPGQNTIYKSGIAGGQSFQWQVNSGSGYVNVVNNGIYSGSTSDSLRLTVPPSSYSGYKYRCLVTTADGVVTGMEYQLQIGVTWTGAVNTAWENPGNWSCGVIPDANTDVLIKGGTVVVHSNTAIRSLTLKPGVQFWVNAGVGFSILH